MRRRVSEKGFGEYLGHPKEVCIASIPYWMYQILKKEIKSVGVTEVRLFELNIKWERLEQ